MLLVTTTLSVTLWEIASVRKDTMEMIAILIMAPVILCVDVI